MEQTFYFLKQDLCCKIGVHNITENGLRKMSKICNCQVWMGRYATRSSAFHLLTQHLPAYKCLSSSLICFRIFSRGFHNNIVASDLKFHKWGMASSFLRLLNTIYMSWKFQCYMPSIPKLYGYNFATLPILKAVFLILWGKYQMPPKVRFHNIPWVPLCLQMEAPSKPQLSLKSYYG